MKVAVLEVSQKWATFVRKFVTKNIKNLPNLVTLMKGNIVRIAKNGYYPSWSISTFWILINATAYHLGQNGPLDF